MPESLNIDSLIQFCAKGDFQAWSKFVEHFSCLIFWTIKDKISKLTHSLPETDIHDIYQQVFLSIWHKQKLKNIRNPKSISRWLIIVTQNETIDYIESKYPVKGMETTDGTNAAPMHRGGVNPAIVFTPQEQTCKNELEKEIALFIDALPLKERRIATLELLYELKYTQISKIVDLPIGTIASVVKRIKADLKLYLQKKGYKI